jgi:sigma-B regulation protein RsbU (phosphoserine phosphatase)
MSRPAASATTSWEELAALALRESGERHLLQRLLALWAAGHGAAEAALYLEGEHGFERLFTVGGHAFPASLPDPAAVAGAEFSSARFPGGLAVARGARQTPEDEPAELVALALGVRVARLKRLLKQQRFQASYRGVELEALYEVGLAIASTLDLEELSEVILLRAVSLLDARRGALYLLEDGQYRLVQTIAGDALPALGARDPRVAPLVAGEATAAHELLPDAAHLLAVPIAIDGRPRGLLIVADKESRAGVGPFPDGDRRTLALFANQAAIALENARLHRDALEKERLEREMQVAADIQRRILPVGPPAVPGYSFLGWNRPARQVGGDYYDFLRLGEDRIGLTVGDVSGKGIPAALLVSTLHSAIRLLLDRIEVGPDLLARLNNHIHESSTPNKFITLLVAELEPNDGTLRYVNAGHNPGLLVRSRGEVETLGTGGLPLGMLAGSVYREDCRRLELGDLVCLYSDGITEAASPADEEFSLRRLGDLLALHRTRPLQEILDRLDATLGEFSCGLPQGDDQTLVLVRREA